jgi:hypothetical protein
MAKEAQDELTRTRDASIAEANAKAQTILARGRNEVAQVREAEQAKLREQLLVCSRQTLAKMIGDVNEDSLRFIVSRVLTAREAAE